MVIKKLLILIFFNFLFINFLHAMDFKERKDLLHDIKQAILTEDLISSSVSTYLEVNYKLPNSIDDLDTVGLSNTSLINPNSTYLNNYSINTTDANLIITYTLKDTEVDDDIIKFYRSDTFREKTFINNYFVQNGEIVDENNIRMILSNDLARHIYGLIVFQDTNITNCTDSPASQICKDDNSDIILVHDDFNNLLYQYDIKNYKKGPMTIENTEDLTKVEFNLVPKGTIFYDNLGAKYMKITDATADDTDIKVKKLN